MFINSMYTYNMYMYINNNIYSIKKLHFNLAANILLLFFILMKKVQSFTSQLKILNERLKCNISEIDNKTHILKTLRLNDMKKMVFPCLTKFSNSV